MFISGTQLNTDVFSQCSSAEKKYKTQEYFRRDDGDREQVKPGSTVKSRVTWCGVVEGERGRVMDVRRELMSGMPVVQVDWEWRGGGGAWWRCDELDLVE